MKKYKFSEQEEMVKDLKTSNLDDRYWLYSQIVAEATADDEYCTSLCNKVLENSINDMIEKIQCIFQRETANMDGTEGKTNIDVLVEWLLHINQD